MTTDMRKNLGMLVLAIPVFVTGIAVAQALSLVGGLIGLFAIAVALISVARIGLELIRGPQVVEPVDAARLP